MIHWIWLHAGLSSANSPWYLFWSGVGADWTRLLMLGGILRYLRARKQQYEDLKKMHERHHRERMNDRR